MALPTPNTDPGKGRVTTTTSGDGAALTNETSKMAKGINDIEDCLLYTSPSPRDKRQSRMPSSA